MKPRIGYVGLTLELYRECMPELVDDLDAFSRELAARLSAFGEVLPAHAISRRTDFEGALAEFAAEDVDVLVIVLLSYSPSLIALPALLKTPVPLLIWNTQRLHAITADFGAEDMVANHGMHGVQDLCSVLRRHERPFHLVTGHYRDPDALAEIGDVIAGAAAARSLDGSRVGILGHTFDGMGDLGVEPSELLARTGVEIRHVSSAVLADHIANVPEGAIDAALESDRAEFVINPEVTDEDHRRSLRVELGLRALADEEELSAVCPLFTAAVDHPGIETLPFLAVSKMLAEGYGYGGEGDPTSAVAVMLMRALTDDTSFVEMFTIDFAGDAVFMNHMAETNHRLAHPDIPPRLILNEAAFLPGKPPVCVFSVQRPGDVTLLNLVAGPGGRLRMIGALAEVEDWGPAADVRSPHFKMKPRCPDGISAFLTRYSKAGGSHHLALGYGDHLRSLRAAADAMDVEWIDLG
jgi:L-arabinose isomerase